PTRIAHVRCALALLAATVGCGDRSPTPASRDHVPKDASVPASKPPPAAGATIALAWSFGQPPATSQGGPRMRDPNEPLPTGPAMIAAGDGRVAIATQDACLELLDLATGKPLVKRACEKDAFALGIAIQDGVLVQAVRGEVRGRSLSDLAVLWTRKDLGNIRFQYQNMPQAVGAAFCVVADQGGSGVANVACLAPRTGKTVGTIKADARSPIALGDQVIVVIEKDTARCYRPDAGVASETVLPGARVEALRPLIQLRAGTNPTWSHRWIAPDGTPVGAVDGGKTMLRGGGLVGGALVTSDFGGARQGGDVVLALDPATGAEKWRTPLGASGPYDPFFAGAGGKLYAAHFDRVASFDATTGAAGPSIAIASEERAVWGDRVLLLVEAQETRSDSDVGDAGVHAIDMPTGTVLLRDDLGRDVPGGQQRSRPIIAGDTAVMIARGQVRAYRMAQ
ncbi:MAG TPA: PQQ-binding-like beta-propeller repeat protein, partial [Kofleriaceae bacterium]|nr:PQQ-binding-like beta-propeller repeat protein [Kofleriaceae bacterium]